MRNWSLLSSNEKHEAQSKEFLDFLEEIYGSDFAWDAAQGAIRRARDRGDTQVRVIDVYEAAGIPVPEYVRENHRYFQTHGRENLDRSGRRLMAKRLRGWFEKWSR